MADVVEQGGDDLLFGPTVQLRKVGALQGVLQLRDPFSVVFKFPGSAEELKYLVHGGARVDVHFSTSVQC